MGGMVQTTGQTPGPTVPALDSGRQRQMRPERHPFGLSMDEWLVIFAGTQALMMAFWVAVEVA